VLHQEVGEVLHQEVGEVLHQEVVAHQVVGAERLREGAEGSSHHSYSNTKQSREDLVFV